MRTRFAAVGLSGVLVASAAGACGRGQPPRPNPTAAASLPATASHEHEAPHGGTLVELGEELAHVELVLDPGEGRLTAFVLDGEAKAGLRVSQPELTVHLRVAGGDLTRIVMRAVPNPLTGESVGDSSEFVGQDPALRGLATLEGRLQALTVKGTPFADVPFGGSRHR